ncbi:hypothetical protein B0H16DRAFT_1467100 [Mycena metata]|uniref:Uncharacterized protein n=1 Tax=Mycena metata TaxID=1033252 RepID=A0AAD7I7A1_9AGAR|nr:hypothetical protein B0H16DRAFT_1467100 [Mycena metata]
MPMERINGVCDAGSSFRLEFSLPADMVVSNVDGLPSGEELEIKIERDFINHDPRILLDQVSPKSLVRNLKEGEPGRNQGEIAETKMHANADAPNQIETKRKTDQIRVQKITKTLKLPWSLLRRRGIAKEASEGRGYTESQLDLLLDHLSFGPDTRHIGVCIV